MVRTGKQAFTVQYLMRLAIVTYFVALSLGLTKGADMRSVSNAFLPTDVSHYTMRAVVLTLSGMILFDIYRRTAALILSICLFWSSYLAILLGGPVASFWVNLGLIGVLLYVGEVGSAENKAPEGEQDGQATIDEPAEQRRESRQTPGSDLPYRKDLEVVRNL